MGKILVAVGGFDVERSGARRMAQERGMELVIHSGDAKLSVPELTEYLADGVVGVLAGVETYDERVFADAPSLKVISRFGTGTDSIDLEAAKRLQIVVRRTPDATTDGVAELTIGATLALLRHVAECDRAMRRGEWRPMTGRLLGERRIGLIGYGRIGRRVGELFQAFGAELVVFDPEIDPQTLPIAVGSVEALLGKVDVLSLHLPLTPKTAGLIGARELDLLCAEAVLINLSRGGIVDEEALHARLSDGRLAGAVVDVFAEEPYSGPLTTLENVIALPHIGSFAKETRARMEVDSVAHLFEELDRLAASKEGGSL